MSGVDIICSAIVVTILTYALIISKDKKKEGNV